MRQLAILLAGLLAGSATTSAQGRLQLGPAIAAQ